jgi:hypothetical protein
MSSVNYIVDGDNHTPRFPHHAAMSHHPHQGLPFQFLVIHLVGPGVVGMLKKMRWDGNKAGPTNDGSNKSAGAKSHSPKC